MRLIVGLGNPGEKYRKNRHNVGFVVLDKLTTKIQSSKFKISEKIPCYLLRTTSYILAKPQTMMNNSGQAVKKLITHYSIPIPNLWVIHDDLDIPLGSYKIQNGKGPREHKGLLSIYDEIGSKDFWHVRVGIENRKVEQVEKVVQVDQAKKISGEEYVLQDFLPEEQEIVNEVVENIIDVLISTRFPK